MKKRFSTLRELRANKHQKAVGANDVFEEMASQDFEWGLDRDLENSLWSLILGEEVGEVCKAILEMKQNDHLQLREELIQVAAVSLQWVEAIDRKINKGKEDAEKEI